MIKRVFLMNPPSELYRRDDRCQSRVDDQTVRVVFPPIELGILAAIARQEGAEVVLKDYPTVQATAETYIADLQAFRPDLILLNTTAHTIREDLAAFSVAREFLPDVRTIVKGEAVAVQAEEVLRNHLELDMVIDGEAEDVFRELLQERDPASINGLIWRASDRSVVRNPERSKLVEFDKLPLPARDLMDHDLYRSPENGRRITAIYAQRGCPSKCIYCPAGSMFGYKVRERAPEQVVEEI